MPLTLKLGELYISRNSCCWTPGAYFVSDNPKNLWQKAGGPYTQRAFYFGGNVNFYKMSRHHSMDRAVIWIPQFTANKRLSVTTLRALINERKKSLFNHIFDIWAGKKKKSVRSPREASSQTKRKPERPSLHSSSLPVAHSCARFHSRNAALRSVIVSVQWAWHGHSVKNNSSQK